MTVYTLDLTELGAAEVAAAGGKGASLGELLRAGVAVPPGFVVTTAAFSEVLDIVDPHRRRRDRIAGLDPDDLDSVGRHTAQLRRLVRQAPVPESLRRAVLAHYRRLAGGAVPAVAVAVRSSATAEDGTDASFAGLQDTYLWIRGEEPALGYMRRCWASLYTVESVVYRLRRRLPEAALAMAVVVQRMVDPRCAGVMFTRSPTTGDRSVVTVEAAWGLGSALVNGAVTPDRYTVSKVTGEVCARVISRKLRRHRPDPSGSGVREQAVPRAEQELPCLTDTELAELVALAKRVEAHYRAPQDIEWAIAGGTVQVLQSRPETVWARRDAAPVVPRRASALDHILHVLGGGPAAAPRPAAGTAPGARAGADGRAAWD